MALTEAVTLDTNKVTSPGSTHAQLLNISTRLKVQTDDKVLIGGFIITGNASKKVIVRGIGPSLSGMSNILANPVLELRGPDGSLITSNDNWADSQRTEIQNSGFAPTNEFESAIIATLAPANYTAILRSTDGSVGIGVVEMYDLDAASDSKLANISSRGFVETGSDVMIAGFIFGNGTASEKVAIRAIGPSLSNIGDVLADPTLELHNANGAVLLFNDDWQDDASQATQLTANGMAPKNNFESAMITTLPPGPYSAIISGKSGAMGVAVAEVYHLL